MTRPSLQRIVVAICIALVASTPAFAQRARQTRAPANHQSDPALARQSVRDSAVDAALMQIIHEKNLSPGYAVVVRDGQVIMARGWGNQAGPGSQPVDGQSLFRIGSVTKTFTALGILALVDEGKLSLDDTIEHWVPGVHIHLKLPRDRQPTIRDALYHYSGFPRSLQGQRPVTDQTIIDNLNTFKVSPGRKHVYSNAAFSTLGFIIQRASGEPYYKFMHDHVFKPLGITDEVWHPTRVPHEHLVWTHNPPGQGRQGGVVDTRELGAGDPAGGVYLSGDDMVKFMKWELAQQENGPLHPQTRKLSHQTASSTLKPPGSGQPVQPMVETGMGWDFAPVDAQNDTLLKNGDLPTEDDHWTAVIGVRPSAHTAAVVMVSGVGGDKMAEAKALIDAAQAGSP